MSSVQPTPDDVFTCLRCGDCCRGYGGTFVSRADMEAIAAFIHADPRTFAEHYCRLSGGKPVLAQRADGYCVFWDRACTIHPVKPRMCRRWPFIESILVDPANWLAMAGSCPGMRTGIPLRAGAGVRGRGAGLRRPGGRPMRRRSRVASGEGAR